MRASANGRSPLHRFQLAYLSAVVIDVKVAFSFEPSEPTTVMITTEMPATMRSSHKRSYTTHIVMDCAITSMRFVKSIKYYISADFYYRNLEYINITTIL
jgi:hypothetical protein